MSNYQKIGTEYLELLVSDPFSIPVWLMLQMKFMGPASMMTQAGKLEKFKAQFSEPIIKP